MWARRPLLLGALAIAGALLTGVAEHGARAQPYGRAWGARLILIDHDRGQGRGQERREERGGGRGNQDGQGEGRGGYRGQPYQPEPRGQPYQPAPRGYAYPAPPPQGYAYPQRAVPPVYAPAPRAYNYAPAPPPRSNAPLGQAMANIRRVMPGRILDAWTEAGPDGRPTYRVRWAAEGGHRVDFIVDAATGAIIGQSGY
jgi:hypothetical protein